MKKLTAFILSVLLVFQLSATALAFTDTENNPFTGKKYTHDDRFDGREIIHGLDISQYQSNVDFKKVKADGVDFVILRAAYRGYSKGTLVKDTTFDKYAKAAVEAGIDIGAYIYSQAITVEEAEEEAEYILGIVKNYKITLPIVFDYEYASPATSRLRAAKLSDKKHTDICLAFCKKVEESGYTAMVYANQSMLTNDINDEDIEKEYDIWLANYSTSPSLSGKLYSKDYSYWQYSSEGSVDGISGRADCNFRYYKKPDQVTDLKITSETISGTTLSWSRIKGCYGYEVYKINLETGAYEKAATLSGASNTTYVDYSSMGVPNTYKVRAINAYKGSFDGGDYSDEVKSKGVFMINVSSTGAGYATFNWQVFPGADEYQVLRADSVNGQYKVIANVNKGTTYYTDYTDDAFKTYYYMVRAILKDDNGELLANQYTSVREIVKPKPKIISTNLKTANSIEVKWTNVSGVTGTEIYRSSGGSYTKIATVSPTATSYINKGLSKGVTYTYKVRHYVIKNGKTYYSSYTSAKSATTLKKMTIKVKAGKKSAKVTYNKIKGASGYEIYMKAPGGKYTLVKTTNKASYTRKKLTTKKKYKFKVRAYKKVGKTKVYGEYSKVKTVKAK